MFPDYNTVYIPEGYGKIRFSRVEIKHILIGVAALTLAFTIVLNSDLAFNLNMSYMATIPITLGVSAFVVLAGFLLMGFGGLMNTNLKTTLNQAIQKEEEKDKAHSPEA